jgi:hypothetical protein
VKVGEAEGQKGWQRWCRRRWGGEGDEGPMLARAAGIDWSSGGAGDVSEGGGRGVRQGRERRRRWILDLWEMKCGR